MSEKNNREIFNLEHRRCDFFEKGFEKKLNNSSYNSKDKIGKAVVDEIIAGVVVSILFLISLVAFVVVYFKRKKKFTAGVWMLLSTTLVMFVISAGLIIDSVVTVRNDPMKLLYGISERLTRTVRTSPILEVEEFFPGAKDFEEMHPTIKLEVAKVAEHMDKLPLTKDTFGNQNEFIGKDVNVDEKGVETGWRILLVSVGENITPDAEKFCPELVKLVRKHKDQVMSCVISVLPPQTTIPRHVGYYKGVLRYMLGVEIPDDRENVYLCANDEKMLWTEGKSVMFDDTFPHKVFNLTDQRRIVLYMDILRPVKSKMLNKLNKFVVKKMKESGITKNEVSKTEYLVNIVDE